MKPAKQTDSLAIESEPQQVKETSPVFKEFSVANAGTTLTLREWKRNLQLASLGTPVDSSSQVLGDGADTHRGSRIEDLKYHGLKLKFFGPPQGKDLWLLSMELTGPAWKTPRGIGVGDSAEQMKTKYPEATNQFSGDPSIYRYTSGEAEIEFIIRERRIIRISLNYMIP